MRPIGLSLIAVFVLMACQDSGPGEAALTSAVPTTRPPPSTTDPAPTTTTIPEEVVRSCDTSIYSGENDWEVLADADKIGSRVALVGVVSSSERPTAAELGPDNTYKYVVTVSKRQVGPVEITASPLLRV